MRRAAIGRALNLSPWTVSKSSCCACVRSLSTELIRAEDSLAAQRWHTAESKPTKHSKKSGHFCRQHPCPSPEGSINTSCWSEEKCARERHKSELALDGKSIRLLSVADLRHCLSTACTSVGFPHSDSVCRAVLPGVFLDFFILIKEKNPLQVLSCFYRLNALDVNVHFVFKERPNTA